MNGPRAHTMKTGKQSMEHRLGNMSVNANKLSKTKGIKGLKYTGAMKTLVKGISAGQVIKMEGIPRGSKTD